MALRYLMKPARKEKLWSVLDRAVEKLSKNEKVLNFETGGNGYECVCIDRSAWQHENQCSLSGENIRIPGHSQFYGPGQSDHRKASRPSV